jgi:putative inorganic carbon (hco3(-)) transporter
MDLKRFSFWGDFQPLLLQLGLIIGGICVAIAGSYIIASTEYGPYLIVACIGAIVAVLIINRPKIGVYVLIVFIYLNLSSIIEIEFGIPSINKALVALVAISILGTKISSKREPLVVGSVGLMVLLHGVILVISILVAEVAPDLDVVADIIKDLVVLLILLQVSIDERTWKTAQWLILYSAAFISLLNVYQLVTGNYTFEFWGLANAPVHQIVENFDSVRPTGPLEDPNFYAQMLLMTLPIGIYRVLGESKKTRKYLALGISLLILSSILGTYSRSGFVTFVVVSALIALERKVQLYKIVLMCLIAATFAGSLLPKGFMERMSALGELTQIFGNSNSITEASLRGRTSESLVAIELFLEYPVLGVGYENYPSYYEEYAARLGLDNRLEDRDAHSLYLEYLAETGVIGFTAFILMIVVIIRSLMHSKKRMTEIGRQDLVFWLSGVQYGLVAYLVNTITLHDDYIRYLRLIIALAASALIMTNTVYQNHHAMKKTKVKVSDGNEQSSNPV